GGFVHVNGCKFLNKDSYLLLKKYAERAVRVGVNLQRNQLLIIHSDIQNATFARLIQTVAYNTGASNVFIDWTDEQSTKEFYLFTNYLSLTDIRKRRKSTYLGGIKRAEIMKLLKKKEKDSDKKS